MFHLSLEPYIDGMLKHGPVISESSFDDRAKPTIHKNMVDKNIALKSGVRSTPAKMKKNKARADRLLSFLDDFRIVNLVETIYKDFQYFFSCPKK